MLVPLIGWYLALSGGVYHFYEVLFGIVVA